MRNINLNLRVLQDSYQWNFVQRFVLKYELIFFFFNAKGLFICYSNIKLALIIFAPIKQY